MVRIVKKPEVRKLEIVQAARDLFMTRDYDQTTMQDVVDALGVAKGTVYYYFPSKDDLLAAVVDSVIAEALQHMSDLVEKAEGNALEKLALLVKAGNIQEEHEDLLEYIHRPGSSGMHTRLLAAAIEKQAPLYARLIEQGCREGLFHTPAPLEAAEFILTGVQFLTDMGIYAWTGEDLARRAQAFPGLLERVLGAPQGSFQFLFQSS